MAIAKEVLDELTKGCHGPEGLVKQPGYGKNGTGGKPAENRRNGKPIKTLQADQGPMEIIEAEA
jgi:hypothetical protein